MVGDRRRSREAVDILGPCVDRAHECVVAAKVAQRLDAARGRASADRDERLRVRPDFLDALDVVGGGDRTLHE